MQIEERLITDRWSIDAEEDAGRADEFPVCDVRYQKNSADSDSAVRFNTSHDDPLMEYRPYLCMNHVVYG